MKGQNELDYLFITWGKPFSYSSGAVNKQIYYIANSLAKSGERVGIVYMSYSSISSLYNFSQKKGIFNRLKGIAGKIPYTKTFGKLYLKIRQKNGEFKFENGIKIFLSNYKLPVLHIKRLVTSYWWGVLVPDKKNMVNSIYFILYHNYSVDIENSNPENLKYLKNAYNISRKISANPSINRNFDRKMPLITEGINLEEYKSNMDFAYKNKHLLLVPLRMNQAKGAGYAIEALKFIHKKYPDISITAFGDYNMPLPGYIQFKYNVSLNELKELYRIAMFFILPSIEEGIPEPLIEAMVSGCIAISTSSGGPETIITHGRDGFLVPIKDPYEIFYQFGKLMVENIDLKKISEAAKITAMKYDIKKTQIDFIDAIKFYEN